MKTFLDCYPCLLKVGLTAGRKASASEAQQIAIMHQSLEVLHSIDPALTPPEIAYLILKIAAEVTGDGDPYREDKHRSTEQALDLYPHMQALIAKAEDPLDTAIRISIAGNIIDFAAADDFDLWGTVERVLAAPYAVDDRPAFMETLDQAKDILYLADNAGETVFDRLLIETINAEYGKPVTYVIKSGPILNDATLEDAVQADLDKIATAIIETGSDTQGTILSRCSKAFRERFDRADMVIAKGQANYETLNEAGSKVFLLLQAKCPVLGRDAGAPVGGVILSQASERQPGG
ncbi:MAG: DUF89 family protein [Anaerolineae bacterium]|nr:DUF89 family protein [Anaerolineae bacterium]